MGTYRKKAIFSLCFLALLIVIVSPAIAAETLSQSQSTEATGILPSNPFYFFKEWGRSIRRTLSFTDLKKAETQLGVVVEQISEIEKLNELQVMKREAFERAIGNYSINIDLLKTYLQALRPNRGNAAVEKLQSTVVSRAVQQYVVLQGLLGKFEGQEHARAFDAAVHGAIDRLVDVTVLAPKLSAELQTAIGGGERDERELHAAVFIERLLRAVPQETVYELTKLQHALIQKWTGRFEFIEHVGGVHDSEPLLQVIDIAREKILDSEMKNALNVMRQAILDGMKESGEVSRTLVMRGINNAAAFIENIAIKASGSNELASTARGLIERARFQIAAAEAFLEDGSLGNAEGQMISAVTAARSAAVLLVTTAADYALELQYMKQYFDTLMGRVRVAKLEPQNSLNLFTKIGEMETSIAKLGDLIARNTSVGKMAAATRAAESMLSTLEQLIKELTN